MAHIIAYWNEDYINSLLPNRKRTIFEFRNLIDSPIKMETEFENLRKHAIDICPSTEKEVSLAKQIQERMRRYGIVTTRKNIHNLDHCSGSGI